MESMGKGKDNTNNQRREVWSNLVEIQRVLHMENEKIKVMLS